MEVESLDRFFVANQGAYGTFSFPDPWDEVEYPNCSLNIDFCDIDTIAEMSASTKFIVVQNKG